MVSTEFTWKGLKISVTGGAKDVVLFLKLLETAPTTIVHENPRPTTRLFQKRGYRREVTLTFLRQMPSSTLGKGASLEQVISNAFQNGLEGTATSSLETATRGVLRRLILEGLVKQEESRYFIKTSNPATDSPAEA